VNISKISELNVPKLATGGIVTGDTLAHIGEGGKREAVLPLDQNTGWMDMLADRIAARNNTPSKIILKVGEKELGYATIGAINGITKQTGGLKLHIV
jgi:SLT domain-containing protein